jgi:hypothetical protein
MAEPIIAKHTSDTKKSGRGQVQRWIGGLAPSLVLRRSNFTLQVGQVYSSIS